MTNGSEIHYVLILMNVYCLLRDGILPECLIRSLKGLQKSQ